MFKRVYLVLFGVHRMAEAGIVSGAFTGNAFALHQVVKPGLTMSSNPTMTGQHRPMAVLPIISSATPLGSTCFHLPIFRSIRAGMERRPYRVVLNGSAFA